MEECKITRSKAKPYSVVRCSYCEHWSHVDDCLGGCDIDGAYSYDDETCERWTVMHGEWYSPNETLPQPDEEVVIRVNNRRVLCKYDETGLFITDTMQGYPCSQVLYWMRIPGDRDG